MKSKLKKPYKTLRQKRLQNFLNNQDFWDIVGMVRGPDSGSCELKHLTVGRIRHVAGVTHSTADKLGVDVTPEPLSVGEQTRRDELLSKRFPHFRRHYWAAVNALVVIARYDLGTERNLLKRGR